MLRELDQRNASGEYVTLSWDKETNIVSLTVHRILADGSELVTASIPEVPHDCAADAFEHPYAYAAHSGSITLPDRASIYADVEADGDEYPELDGSDEQDEYGYGGSSTLPPESEV